LKHDASWLHAKLTEDRDVDPIVERDLRDIKIFPASSADAAHTQIEVLATLERHLSARECRRRRSVAKSTQTRDLNSMARIVPLWRSGELSLHRFDHPAEHEDRPYESVASEFTASFVDDGTFDLHVESDRWRVAQGDVFLRHPGMRYRAGFDGRGFSDTCLTLTYLAADDDRFDAARSWAHAGRPVLRVSNRLRYLRWALQRAIQERAPMLIEYCAVELFKDPGESPAPLFRERKFAWYAERVHAARERLEAEIDHAHTVSDLASSVGMSMFHFTRVFTALVGASPHRYLGEARLRAAHAMLQAGGSVTETCIACGFNSLSHFHQRFTGRYGVAPSRINVRKLARNRKQRQPSPV
jgi:AraC-like DNA-binding protein